MTLTIEPFGWARDLAPADLSAVTRIFNAVWAEWLPGEPPISEAAYVDLDRFTAHPERVVRRLARDDQGRVVGHGNLHWREGPGACVLKLLVDPDRRYEGVGRRLGGALTHEARANGRRGLTVEVADGSAAEAVSRAAGFRPDMVMEQNRTDPRAALPRLVPPAQLTQARPRYPGPCTKGSSG